MTGHMTPTDWATAATVCTRLELDTLTLRDRNLSLRQIALALDVSVSTIRHRLFNAHRKIEIQQRKDAA